MPRIISYTPSWLSGPSPGFELFKSSKTPLSSPHSGSKLQSRIGHGEVTDSSTACTGPKKLLACRGTEIFVAVDNQIRWSDLCMLKDDWTEKHGQNDAAPDTEDVDLRQTSYRIREPIRQLSVSPNHNFLAILTSHTVHVGLLPNSSKLGQGDMTPIKLRRLQLGRTTHVVSQSPIASLLWHPFGADGNCLVTITENAVLRLWELHAEDSFSYDSPTLAINLKKLAIGVSEKDDFSPDKLGRNRSYSMDEIGMDVASACFGGTGSSDESPWSAMTLWIAMRGGDVYALCPVLPSKWQPSSTTLPSLSAIAVSNDITMGEESLPPEELQRCRDQYQWISDLDGQEPRILPGNLPLASSTQIFSRPLQPGIPKLQGPFQLSSEDEVELDIADMHVVAAKIDSEELLYGEEIGSDSGLGAEDNLGLSASIVCLLTRTGRLHLYVDFTGVEGQWLPRNKPNQLPLPGPDPCLTVIEILDTLPSDLVAENEWPAISSDPQSRYSFFITHGQGVWFFNFEPWVRNLEDEFQSSANTSTAFRINILANGSGTLRERMLDFRQEQQRQTGDPAAVVVLHDSDLGYFLLSVLNGVPHAAVLDRPDSSSSSNDADNVEDLVQDAGTLTLGPARSPYIPPNSLWGQSRLPSFVDDHVQNRHKKALKEEIRLSSATLDLMTQAHRVVSEETHALSVAAADLFRRCERLQDELRDQIERVKEAADRIEQITDKELPAPGYDDSGKKSAVERRIAEVNSKQGQLMSRFNKLRINFANREGPELSDRERGFVSDVAMYEKSIMRPNEQPSEEYDEDTLQPWERLDQARQLKDKLITHARNISSEENVRGGSSLNVPSAFRKSRIAQVMNLLERESALVDAAQMRLERLSLVSIS